MMYVNETIKIENTTFYYVDDITDDLIDTYLGNADIVVNKGITYFNCPCSLDIETSSFYLGDSQKHATMYIWALNLNGLSLYGRTWIELLKFFARLYETYSLDNKFRIPIFVQNLGYEFQFLRHYFNWSNIFARTERKPIYALTDIGIEFKCSYFLSGYPLKKIAENLTKYKIEKLSGELDYSLIRHSKTPLSTKELHYLLNDVTIIEYYIREEIERNDNNIAKIPLTQTGYIRRLVRENCYPKSNRNEYQKFRNLISTLTIESEEYKQLKRAFMGGFTHANAHKVNRTISNVTSIDLSSSYPSVMVNEKFPMSKGELIYEPTRKEIEYYFKSHACIFEIEFKELESITFTDHPLSASKCFRKISVIEDNGRVVSAEQLATTLTEIDLITIQRFYAWKSYKIMNMRVYQKSYLPTPFVKTILDLYGQKTMLKDITGKEAEYMHSKQLINSCFGMTVTDIVNDDIIYKKNNWDKTELNEYLMLDKIDKYNKAKQRFLFYPWGIYVTAYARRNLFTGIYEFSGDYCYSDTDSIKCENYTNHIDYINDYNTLILEKNEMAMKYHSLPVELTYPTDIEDRKRYLGIWEKDAEYIQFKTLGAKRYMYSYINKKTKDLDYNLTVSGVNKKVAIPYLQCESIKQKCTPFDLFNYNLVIPEGFTGKNTLTYIDYEQSGIITDYLNNIMAFSEMSAIHMEEASYNFSISDSFFEYLYGYINIGNNQENIVQNA